ncbi:hypothetical protein NX784_27560 [Massilia pinisoli]|uniref:Uncharacterized protein n=1 Tax=Massilia pinisoli TaxID=1772194 RepID=A0ABT1ZZH7_9BURK|nr:hypothetical protein [Massilia pinisoli]MCS0585342.1 hypothetical protein [Massilia pinisoli]
MPLPTFRKSITLKNHHVYAEVVDNPDSEDSLFKGCVVVRQLWDELGEFIEVRFGDMSCDRKALISKVYSEYCKIVNEILHIDLKLEGEVQPIDAVEDGISKLSAPNDSVNLEFMQNETDEFSENSEMDSEGRISATFVKQVREADTQLESIIDKIVREVEQFSSRASENEEQYGDEPDSRDPEDDDEYEDEPDPCDPEDDDEYKDGPDSHDPEEDDKEYEGEPDSRDPESEDEYKEVDYFSLKDECEEELGDTSESKNSSSQAKKIAIKNFKTKKRREIL